jgi:acetoin utilization protein AcuB
MEATDFMTRNVLTIAPNATVREAIRLIEDQEIRHLPVVDESRLVGMLSDRDLREYRLPLMEELEEPDQADRLLDTPISTVMNANVVALDSTESLTSAIDAMLEYGVGAVPVVDRRSDELVGIVSYVDVLKAVRPLTEE